MDPIRQLELTALARQKALREATALGDSDIQKFYCDRVLFITGGSGFLGKQLIEKLLRSCRISKIYMLLRSKKEKTIHERLEELLKESVYDGLREEQPDFADKIVPVEGEMSEIRLGIDDAHWETLTKEVDAIFHSAATTRFDETLRIATLINVRGTRECLKLGKACKKLCSYVHISTAYSNSIAPLIGREVDEKFYPSPIPPEAMISMAENVDDERLANITDGLIKDWPNTYSFTKALAEELIRTTSDGLPICVIRPGIVISSISEPAPDWIDTSAIYSASGVLSGVGLGLIHAIPANVDASLGIIPCDYVNNIVIAAGRETAVNQKKGGNDTKIYAVTPARRNPVTWDICEKAIRANRWRIPSPSAMYYGCVIETNSNTLFWLLSVLFHIIPAHIADFISLLIEKERRFVKLAKKFYNLCSAVSYFMRNEWKIHDHNTKRLYDNLTEQDKIIFNFDITDIKWSEYVIMWCLGIRKYLVKDGLKNTDYAIKKMKLFALLHYGVVVPLYAYVSWKLVFFTFSTAINLITAVYNYRCLY